MTNNNFSLFDIFVVILKRKTVFAINFIIVFLVAVGISLLLPKSYKSTVVFIPPGQSSSGLLSMLGNNFSPDLQLGSELSKRQYVALLHSRELREKLIKKFDLIKVYKLEQAKNSLDVTLKKLEKVILIKENEEGGLGITDVISVEVTVIDQKAKRASDMANELFSLLEEKAITINQRESKFKVEFLKQQLGIADSMLSLARIKLKTFQKTNKVYDLSSQSKLTARALAQLEADKMSFEMQKTYLLKTFSPQNIEINMLNEKIAIYNNKIEDLEQKNNQGLTPGFQKSLNIADEYTDLIKESETYFQLSVSIRQQLEIAKIKLQKSYSSISLIDSARPAQYKFKPKRALVVIVLTGIYMIILFTWVLFKEYFSYIRLKYPEKINSLINAVK